MHLVQVDPIGAEAPQTGFAATDDVTARQAAIVRSVAHSTIDLGRQDHAIAPTLERFAEHPLRLAARVHVGRIEQVDAGVEAAIHQPPRFCHIGGANHALAIVTGEGHGAETEEGYLESSRAETTVVHVLPFAGWFGRRALPTRHW